METIEAHIEGYSPKGHGMAKIGTRRPVEVPRTLDGEIVELEAPRKRLRRRGRLKSIEKRSSARREPFCPHFKACGGCCWQHMAIEEQRSFKQAKIERLFGQKSRPILYPKEERRYRNKMEFSFTAGHFEQTLGLMPYYGGPVAVDIADCQIADPWMAKALKQTRAWWRATGHRAFHPRSGEGALRTLTLRAQQTGHKMAVLTVSGDPRFALKRGEIEEFTERIEKTTEDPLAIFLQIHQAIRGQPTQIFTMHLAGPTEIEETISIEGEDLYAVIGPRSFFQPNTAGAKLIIEQVGIAMQSAEPGLLVDLYCGAGLLGMSQSRRFKEVVGVEVVPEATLDGEAALKRSGIENMRFLSGSVGQSLEGLSLRPDALIIDPPRSGCESAISGILGLQAPHLVYVSCNPKTQAADVELFKSGGYRIEWIQPIDQFPQTHHVENVVYMRR